MDFILPLCLRAAAWHRGALRRAPESPCRCPTVVPRLLIRRFWRRKWVFIPVGNTRVSHPQKTPLRAGVQEGAPAPAPALLPLGAGPTPPHCLPAVLAAHPRCPGPLQHGSWCSASRCQPPFLIREFSERAVPAHWEVSLTQEETQALSAPKFELSLEQRRKMPSPLERFMCLHIPAAHHGHVSGSSFSSRPVLQCCCTGTCRLSSPAVPCPGPFLWLFQLLTPSLMHPFLHQLEYSTA